MAYSNSFQFLGPGRIPQINLDNTGQAPGLGNYQFPPVDFNQPAPTPAEPDTSQTDPLAAFQPQHHFIDLLSQMLEQYPQRQEPDKFHQILSVLAGAGGTRPAAVVGGQPVGFINAPAEEIMKAQDLARYRPFYENLQDWENKLKPIQMGAQDERYQNTLYSTLLNNMAKNANTAQRNQTYAENVEGLNTRRGEQSNIDWYKADTSRLRANAYTFDKLHPDWKADPLLPGETLKFRNPKNPGEVFDTFLDSGKLTDEEKLNIQNAGKLAVARVQAGKTEEAGWGTVLVDGKMWRVNPRLKKMEPMPDIDQTAPETAPVSTTPPAVAPAQATSPTVAPSKNAPVPIPPVPTKVFPTTTPAQTTVIGAPTAPGQHTITRIGAPKSNQVNATTQAQMDAAAMLLPHVPKLTAQAVDLEKRGLFGPVMSRVRELATKIGTTGSTADVKKSLEEFGNDVVNDPVIKRSNDFVVGQFTANLKLMASGMGKVHGGTRGGGSIMMIKYMKEILTADSTLPMFLGRMSTLEDYIKGYAAGPQGVQKTPFDEIIDKVLSGKKPGAK